MAGMAVRSSYSMAYDFMAGDFHYINASAPPFGNRSTQTDPPAGSTIPYADAAGGDPHPMVSNGVDTPFVQAGGFGSMDPDINSPRVQSWNVTIERQIGTDWGISAQLSWQLLRPAVGAGGAQPGRLPGTRPCRSTALGIRSSSTNAEPEQRRRLYAGEPSVMDSDHRRLGHQHRRRATRIIAA